MRARESKQAARGEGSALVHKSVLEGLARATYVARRAKDEWFVGGPGFVDAHSDHFRRVSLAEATEADPSVADVLDLTPGMHAYRSDQDNWERAAIPSGRVFLLTYDARPTRAVSKAGSIGGAIVNCWVVAKSLAAARKQAREYLEGSGWAVLDGLGESEKQADDLAEGTEQYFAQARVDGFVCVLHQYPPEPADA